MPTLHATAALLSAACDIDGLAALAAAIGFEGLPATLDADDALRLGIPSEFAAAHLLTGPGALRALLLEVPAGRPVREAVSRLATRLASRTPHLLWIALVAERGGSGLTMAAWSAERSPPVVAALLCDRRRIVESDAETVCSLAASGDAVDVLTHLRWLELLGREALTRRFYRALEGAVHRMADSATGVRRSTAEERQELALLNASRMLFLCFLQSRGWLDGDHRFLARTFERRMEGGGGYHSRTLLPLFFGTLNTRLRDRSAAARAFGRVPFLNGGLFARTDLERRLGNLRFDDAAFGALHGEVLDRHRFTAREERGGWSEAAVDPEMLGKAFESLMASRERRRSGAFYTPQPIVARLTSESLGRVLGDARVPAATIDGLVSGRSVPVDDPAPTRERLARITVLDPACGSGAFLVHTLETLASLTAQLGDRRPATVIRREILTRSIFGVDINPMAVWLCELRLWLSVVMESEESDPMRILPLPNLDRHVRIGDALAGGRRPFAIASAGGPRLTQLRSRYARSSGARKRSLGRQLEREERSRAVTAAEAELTRVSAERRELVSSLRSRDLFGERHSAPAADRTRLAELRRETRDLRATLRRLRGGGALPFSFASHFADIAALGGFDMVVGNPPWVRLHNIPSAARRALRRDYTVFRGAPWSAGASGAGAGAGFAAQVDLAALFVERSLALARPDGVVALLLPVKLWRSLAGGGVRALLAAHGEVEAIEDWSEAPTTFDAAVYPSAIIVRRRESGDTARPPLARDRVDRDPEIAEVRSEPARARRPTASGSAGCAGGRTSIVVHTRRGAVGWSTATAQLAFDATPGSPWLLLPPDARRAFDLVLQAGIPLAESPIGRPWLGVKSGCNEAFEVVARGVRGETALVAGAGRTGEVERMLLRPLLRGEDVTAWRAPDLSRWIVWTHDGGGAPLRSLPPHAGRWLEPWRRRLNERADARRQARWWRLFRVESAAFDVPRVVWSDFGRAPRALVLDVGDPIVPLNSCYVARCRDELDAFALAALLNSSLAAAWLHTLAEPARGGYRRFLGWTMSLLPLPSDWEAARHSLAPLARRALAGEPPGAAALLEVAVQAYGLSFEDVEPLLGWVGRHA